MKNKDSSKYMGGLKYIFPFRPLQNEVITLPLDGKMDLQNSLAMFGIQLWPLLMADCFLIACVWHFSGCW